MRASYYGWPRLARSKSNRHTLYRFVEGAAQRLFPQIRVPEWQFRWAGKVALTTDHMPRVHELAPGLRTCLGYNGRGVAMATAMGKALADWIAPVTSMRFLCRRRRSSRSRCMAFAGRYSS